VVTGQTIVSPVSVTHPVSASEIVVPIMSNYVKLEPHLAKADVGRNTILRTSATATPSAPSTKTAAATTPTSVTVMGEVVALEVL